MKKFAYGLALLVLVGAAYWPYRMDALRKDPPLPEPTCEELLAKVTRRQTENMRQSERTLADLRREFGKHAEDMRHMFAYLAGVNEAEKRYLPCYLPPK